MKRILGLVVGLVMVGGLALAQTPGPVPHPGGPPSGAAGGALGGTYPDPTLAAQATNTVLGNATSGSAAPTALAVGSCSATGSALIWTTNSGYGCATGYAPLASPTFTGNVVTAATANSLPGLQVGTNNTGGSIAAYAAFIGSNNNAANGLLVAGGTNASQTILRGQTYAGVDALVLSGAGALGLGMQPVEILDITKTQNGAGTTVKILNAGTGNSSANFNASNGTNSGTFGILGTGYGTSGIFTANDTYINTGAGFLINVPTGNTIRMGVNAVERWRFSSSDARLNIGSDVRNTAFGTGDLLDVAGTSTAAIGLTLENQNTGTAALSIVRIANLTNYLALAMTSTGFSGAYLTSGPSGEQAAIYTQLAKPLVLGYNNTASITLTAATSAGIQFNKYGAGAITSDSSGNLTATSDPRLKIDKGNFTRGLADVLKIQPKLYSWKKESGMETRGIYAGFMASNDFPIKEAVGKGPDGYNTFSDRPVTAALVNSVKQLSAANDNLQSQIDELKSVVAQLKVAR